MVAELQFAKWHGTGNDFILVDDHSGTFPDADEQLVQRLCHRHFGIGSDGLVLVRPSRVLETDFHMEFLNPDGSRSFCGNGSRCAFAFWCSLMPGRSSARFTAIDGVHEAWWVGDEVCISLLPAGPLRTETDGSDVDQVHTGSPHEVVWVPDVDAVDLTKDGPIRRYAARHGERGSNVNYVQVRHDGLRMRTYERGVEAETLSCGSGVVAAALSAMNRGAVPASVAVHTRGGDLRVNARRSADGTFEQVQLTGPVQLVFIGALSLV